MDTSMLVPEDRAKALKAQSLVYPSHTLTPRQHQDLELLLGRAYAPLTGYLGREDCRSVLQSMRLADGRLWPMPVSLDIAEGLARQLKPGDPLALRDAEGFMLAVLTVTDVWAGSPEAEATALFGASAVADHPGAMAYVRETAPWRVAGPVCGLAMPPHADFTDLRLTPAALTALTRARGWRRVLACPFSGLLHQRDLAVCIQAATEHGARLLLVRTVGDALAGGAAHFAGVRCAMLAAQSLPQHFAQLTLLPLPVRQAGPRQALLEALVHKNLGATHTLVAPDQADPLAGTQRLFYPRGAAQALVADHAGETGIALVAATDMDYVEEQGRYVPVNRITPGQTVRRMDNVRFSRHLEFDQDIPAWHTLPAITAELRTVFPPRSRQGITLFMTGLSGAGKSTLAKLLYVMFMELRTRPVTLLDGDIVRRHLSSELTFSRAHRDLNIARIGFVASEITKNGGIAICAPIAPYASSRAVARSLVSPHGGFVEIHVATALSVCEQRDRKGLYAKARAGLVKDVTGIDDPYEVPEQPEIRLDTAQLTPGEAAQEVMLYLTGQGYLA
ncbi:adenylyl-sulfate kinase [Solidesulfovibrio sp.]